MYKSIQIAENEVGYRAENDDDKYSKDLFPNAHPMPWCTTFIEWVFKEAYGEEKAKEMLYLPDGFITSVPALVTLIKHNQHWWFKTVNVGWLAFLRPNLEWTNHVGLVTDVTNTEVTLISGNVDSEVKYLTFTRGDVRISGFGEILYEDSNV